MALSRLQFRLSTLLWITLAVGCFFGGMAVQLAKVDRLSREIERLDGVLSEYKLQHELEQRCEFDPPL